MRTFSAADVAFFLEEGEALARLQPRYAIDGHFG